MDKFITVYHINIPVWSSNKHLTFLMSIIKIKKKVIQPIIKLKSKHEIKINFKSQLTHDIIITFRIGTTMNILRGLGFDHDPQLQLSILPMGHSFYCSKKFSATPQKNIFPKRKL